MTRGAELRIVEELRQLARKRRVPEAWHEWRAAAAIEQLYDALDALCHTLNGNGYATEHADAALRKARGEQ